MFDCCLFSPIVNRYANNISRYEAGGNKKHLPLWIDASFRLEKAEALAEAIDHAGEDGLLPVDYHQDAIHELLAGAE